MHNAEKRTRWIGTGFSIGHMISVLAEMLLMIYLADNSISTSTTTTTKINELSFWGGIVGVIALCSIGIINIISIKKWGKTGSSILANKVSNKTGILGPFGSSLVTGTIFGMGFDTATQISAVALSAVASVTVGVQTSLILAGFFAISMISVDTLNSIILRSVFAQIFNKKGFKYMSYGLSGMALAISSFESYSIITNNTGIITPLIGPILAMIIISVSFGYAFAIGKREKEIERKTQGNLKYKK